MIFHHMQPTIENGKYVTQPMTVQFDSMMGLHVTDGSSKYRIDTHGGEMSYGLPADTVSVILWAERKMREEQLLEEKLRQFPALKEAKDHFDTILALVKNFKESNNEQPK